jgi:mRNA interferase MazF
MQGDIIIVPFPFTDLTRTKERPGIIISNNRKGEDMIVVAITSNKQSEGIPIHSSDLIQGEMYQNSHAKPAKIASLHRSIIRKRIGACSRKKTTEICNAVINHIKTTSTN